MTGSLPRNWRIVKLGDCLRRRRNTVLPATLPDDLVGLVGLEDIQDGGRGGITVRQTKPGDIQSLKTWFCAGDILYGKLRPYLNKVGIAPRSGLCSTEIWAFSPDPMIQPRFGAYFLASSYFVDRVASLTKGANLPRLDTGTFDSVEIALPPLSEQERIVEILQEAEEIRHLRAEAEAYATALIPAIYHQFFGTNSHSSRWPEVSIREIAKKGDDSIRTGPFGSDLLHSEFVDAGVAVLGIDNVVLNRFRWSERRFITYAKYADLTRFRVFPGDVMVTIMGSVGRVAMAPADLPEAISTKHLCVITPDTKRILPTFLWATLLLDPTVRSQTRAVAKGAIMEGWNSRIIKALRFRLPPMKAQESFDRQVKQALDIEASDANHSIASSLIESLSAHAFSGQLTVDWRKANQEQLAHEARQRDVLLPEAGASFFRSSRATFQEAPGHIDLPTAGIYSDLNREQRALLLNIQQNFASTHQPRYFSAQSLSSSMEGTLRRNHQVIEGDLALLAARGLLIPVSREEETENTGEYVFGNAYRLPLRGYESGLDDKNDPQLGDHRRLHELERLAALLEKGKALP